MANRRKPAEAGTVTLRFNAVPHHVLEADGETTNGGGTITVSEETAQLLLAADWIDVSLADTKTPTWPRGHAEIDALAQRIGVELPAVPAGGGTKPPTTADKIAALEAAGFTPATAFAAAESKPDEPTGEPGQNDQEE